MAPRVSVIIATWNAGDVLGACLDSVLRQEVAGGFETIVVDNASTDATAELLRSYGDRIRVISNDRNARYAGANNQAAHVARGRVLFFLNSDTELREAGTLERLADAAEQPGVALAGPRLVNPDGTLQPSCGSHPTVPRALLVGVGAHRLLPDSARARIAPARWAHDAPRDADWVMGAAIAVPASLFAELGGFWDTMYAEEQDLARRAQQRGLHVRFDPSATVMHIGSHSLSQKWSDAERAKRVALAEIAFLRTHYGPARRGAIRLVTGLAYGARTVVFGLLRRRARSEVYAAMARAYLGRGR